MFSPDNNNRNVAIPEDAGGIIIAQNVIDKVSSILGETINTEPLLKGKYDVDDEMVRLRIPTRIRIDKIFPYRHDKAKKAALLKAIGEHDKVVYLKRLWEDKFDETMSIIQNEASTDITSFIRKAVRRAQVRARGRSRREAIVAVRHAVRRIVSCNRIKRMMYVLLSGAPRVDGPFRAPGGHYLGEDNMFFQLWRLREEARIIAGQEPVVPPRPPDLIPDEDDDEDDAEPRSKGSYMAAIKQGLLDAKKGNGKTLSEAEITDLIYTLEETAKPIARKDWVVESAIGNARLQLLEVGELSDEPEWKQIRNREDALKHVRDGWNGLRDVVKARL